MKVRIAVAPRAGAFDVAELTELVDGLESLGFDTIWLSDVPLTPSADPGIALAYAAARTRRLKLGANVVPLGRNPYLLAKALAQLDRLSGGRLLMSLVPGLAQPGERGILDVAGDRGRRMDDVVPLLRRWWSGEAVQAGVTLPTLPVQDPLEIWLGGIGPRALERAGRLGDGWLGAAVTPEEAEAARETIEKAAGDAGRTIDPEHFGLSIPYARHEPDASTYAFLRQRRPDADPRRLLPVGPAALTSLIRDLMDAGLSKFVLRPAGPFAGWADELDWLAENILPLQS